MIKHIKIILINCFVLLVGCIIIELIFGGWLSNKNKLKNLNLIVNKKYVYSSNLYTSTPIEITYSRDKYGLRGESAFNKPEGIDILTIGGSTTDQKYVSDGETWQDFLEQSFNINGKKVIVSNAGVDGQTTFGHIKNFEVWFPQIPNLKPKYILFYIGLNDFLRLTENKKHDDIYGNYSLKSKIMVNSVLFNLVRTIRGILLANRHKVMHRKLDFTKINYVKKGINQKEFYDLNEKNLDNFEKRLAILINHTEDLGAEAIFVTQPTKYYKWDKKGQLMGWSDTLTINKYTFNGVDYFNILCKINDRIRKVAKDKFTVVELTTLPIFENKDFYDFYHNTPLGAKKIGQEIYNQIKHKFN